MIASTSPETGKTVIVLFRGTLSEISLPEVRIPFPPFVIEPKPIVQKDDTPGIDELGIVLKEEYQGSNVDVRIYDSVRLETAIDFHPPQIEKSAEEVGSGRALADLQTIGLDTIDKLIVVGKSGGGLSAINLAKKLGDFPVDLLVQMDSVDSVSFYKSLDTGALIEEAIDPFLPDRIDISDGSDQADVNGFNDRRANLYPPQDGALPANVLRGLNLYQIAASTNPYEQTLAHPADFQGTQNVVGSTNINVEDFLGDKNITHMNIDNNLAVRDLVLGEIAKELSTPLLADSGPARFQGGTLVLNVGPNAGARKFGDTVDGREFLTVVPDETGVPTRIVVKGFGTAQSYRDVDRIDANAGLEEDVIDASRVALTVELEGGQGDDVLRAGGADDRLAGGPGHDLLDGGPGFDTADYYDSKAPVRLLLSPTDEYGVGGVAGTANRPAGLAGGDAEGDTLTGIEKVAGSNVRTGAAYDDLVFGFDGGTAADLWGGNDIFDNRETATGRDRVAGGDGNDRIWTGGGNDELYGEAGGDTLVGEAGADKHDGGAGRDWLNYTGSPAGVRVILSQTDRYNVGSRLGPDNGLGSVAPGGKGGHADGDTYVSMENVVGSNLEDFIYGYDNQEQARVPGENFVRGTTAELKRGDDWFDNNHLLDRVDVVRGDEGHDHIWTGAGNDILNGGPENDHLWGEAGRDIFVFEGDFDLDVVHDFEPGNDRLWVVGFARDQATTSLSGADTVVKLVGDQPWKTYETITLEGFKAPTGFLDQIVFSDHGPTAPLG